MKPFLQSAVVAAALCLTAARASGEPVRFQLITEAAKGNGKLVNGVSVDPKDWPALVTAVVGWKLQSGVQVPLRCSGALVGRGVLLTAAHCLDPGSGSVIKHSIELELAAGQIATLACNVPASYLASDNPPPRTADDFALCTFPVPAGIRLPLAEAIDAKAMPQAREPILMTGFGCQEMEFRFGTWRPVLSTDPPTLVIADATISLIPSASPDFKDGFISIISAVTNGQQQPALCSGDSGGPMFVGASLMHQNNRRRIVGVNSWVSSVSVSFIRSGIASLATPGFARFTKAWAAANPGRAICGWADHLPVGECRQ